MAKRGIITKSILILSLVSLFTDMASEMLYPIMPLYLKSIGFSILLIGVLEGIAEATAGFSKGYFGILSDSKGTRLPFVRLGYLLSALSKPMLAIFTSVSWVFASRTLDRIGKGIRTGARDAILADESTPETRAEVFGFHRSLDTMGAVLGPLIALLFLYFYPGNYKILFLIAFVPGIVAVLLTFILKEKTPLLKNSSKKGFLESLVYWKESSSNYKKLVVGLLAFALFNSSDVFLLLKMKEAGIEDKVLIGIYIFYNLIFALLAYPLGKWADKIGLKKMYLIGLMLFVSVYGNMAFAADIASFIFIFLLYGAYAAATEGISKAWISTVVNPRDKASAIGTFSGLASICSLFASSICGLIWFYSNSMFAFLISAAVALLVAVYLLCFDFGKLHQN